MVSIIWRLEFSSFFFSRFSTFSTIFFNQNSGSLLVRLKMDNDFSVNCF